MCFCRPSVELCFLSDLGFHVDFDFTASIRAEKIQINGKISFFLLLFFPPQHAAANSLATTCLKWNRGELSYVTVISLYNFMRVASCSELAASSAPMQCYFQTSPVMLTRGFVP